MGIFAEQVDRRVYPFIVGVEKKFDCGAALGNLNLDGHGELGPCKSFLVLRKKILEEFMGKENVDINSIHNLLHQMTKKDSQCLICPARNICGGGCAYESYVEGGRNIGHNHCSIVKEFLNLIISDLAELNASETEKHGWSVMDIKCREKIMGKIVRSNKPMRFSLGHYLPLSN